MDQRTINPKQLVDEFKKSGEFDRLRRQLLAHFASSDNVRPLMSRVEEIVREKLSGDERLEHKTREAVHSDVMQDLERYPIVERAVNDLAVFKDNTLLASIEQYARNIVQGESNENTKLWEPKPTRRDEEDEDNEDNNGSSDYTEDEEPDDDLLIITDTNNDTTARLRSHKPEAEDGTNEIKESDGSPPPPRSPQSQTKQTNLRSGTPSSAFQANAADKSLHIPPWPDGREDLKPALSDSHNSVHATISSDSPLPVTVLARGTAETLVVGAAVTDVQDTNKTGNFPSSGPEERIMQHSSENFTSPQGEFRGDRATHVRDLADTGGDELAVKREVSGASSPPPRHHSPSHSSPRTSPT